MEQIDSGGETRRLSNDSHIPRDMGSLGKDIAAILPKEAVPTSPITAH